MTTIVWGPFPSVTNIGIGCRILDEHNGDEGLMCWVGNSNA